MNLVIEVLGISQLQLVLGISFEANAHEVVVPGALSRNHEEAEEAIGEEHLDLLVVGGQISFGVITLVSVLLAPFEATRSDLVGG